jgi:putative acetyltransferase
VQVRLATVDDAPALLAHVQAVVAAGEGVVKYPDEVLADLEQWRARLAPVDGYASVLVGEVAGLGLVADVLLARSSLRMLRHVGTVGLGVHPAAQGVGLGRVMMETILARARGWRDPDGGRIRRVELFARADNTRALALYRSLGFLVEGVRRGYVRTEAGFVDDVVMGLLLA